MEVEQRIRELLMATPKAKGTVGVGRLWPTNHVGSTVNCWRGHVDRHPERSIMMVLKAEGSMRFFP
jgi:hypothetical protein